MDKRIFNYWFWGFIAVLVPLNLIGNGFDYPELQLYSKPLLLPFLIGMFWTATKGTSSSLKLPIILALLLSWVGDVALIFDEDYPFMFTIGLGGFLMAHLHYSFVFITSGKKGKRIEKSAWIIMPFMLLYTVGLLNVLWPNLGELKIPVFVYAIVLLSMGITSLIRNQKTGYYWVLFGAILFIASDSILALNKFNTPIYLGKLFTMLTYVLAQLFIVIGVTKLIISQD